MEEPLLVPEKKMQNLGTFGIIRLAIEVPLRSHNFIIFTFLTSLPFFCSTLLQKLPSLLNLAFFDSISSYYYYYSYNYNLIHDAALVLDFTTWLLKGWIVDFFRFVIAITTIHSASKVFTSKKSTSLRNLMQYPITKASVMGPLFTFLLMSSFSSVSLDLVTHWGGWGPLVMTRTMFFQVVHGITYAAALIKWSEYCALWNVGFVVSILEGDNKITGLEAFSASSDLMRGDRLRGTVLMVLYHVWRLGLGLPTFFPRYSYWGIFSYGIVYKIVDTILLCLGLVMNWVVCVVYYHDCKNRQRGKVVVEEGERSHELVGSTNEFKD